LVIAGNDMNIVEQLFGAQIKTSEEMPPCVFDGVKRFRKMGIPETLEKYFGTRIRVSPIAQILTQGRDDDRLPRFDYWWKSGEIENRHNYRCRQTDEMIGVIYTINQDSLQTISIFDGKHWCDYPMVSTPLCRVEVRAIDKERMSVQLRMVGDVSGNMPVWECEIAHSRDFARIAPGIVGCIEEYAIRSK
jgi:hypothetical protein